MVERYRPKLKGRKPPSYTPREMLAMENADRVIARVHLNGEWKEQEFFPEAGQTVRSKLAEVQHALRHHIDPNSGIILYVGGMADQGGEEKELMKAAVPRDMIPQELKR